MLQSEGSCWAQNCCQITSETTCHRDGFSRAGPNKHQPRIHQYRTSCNRCREISECSTEKLAVLSCLYVINYWGYKQRPQVTWKRFQSTFWYDNIYVYFSERTVDLCDEVLKESLRGACLIHWIIFLLTSLQQVIRYEQHIKSIFFLSR